jgi:hypothetical protein
MADAVLKECGTVRIYLDLNMIVQTGSQLVKATTAVGTLSRNPVEVRYLIDNKRDFF